MLCTRQFPFAMKYTKVSIPAWILLLCILQACAPEVKSPRVTRLWNDSWLFTPGDPAGASEPGFDDRAWRSLDLPHDWSIEGSFSADHPATPGGGALPGGIGWYRKHFSIPEADSGKLVYAAFDGIYQNSEVWVNGHFLGKRPNGYISFRYEFSPYLNPSPADNVIAVRVDNSLQPNSRWYSGSGIYRDVRLVMTGKVALDHWGVFVTTPKVSEKEAVVKVTTALCNRLPGPVTVQITSSVIGAGGRKITAVSGELRMDGEAGQEVVHELVVGNPSLWSVDDPAMYELVTEVLSGGEVTDRVVTPFGIRSFRFNAETGFSLNGSPLKLKGVCNHHDLGCLGAAAYPRAVERQLEILKEMGCNALRTSHNPPSPVLLDLCDRMGFLVMDETFDMWALGKTPHDYHLHWEAWHARDLSDHIRRDRNHPSVIMWSIGNEILEQWDSTGMEMARELAAIVRGLDDTRPVTSGCNETSPGNSILRSGALDVVGFNYHNEQFAEVPVNFPGMPFVASETTSALATRGSYDMPSDSIRIWPIRWDIPHPSMNPDHTCSAYDNCHAPWGSTHEESLLAVLKQEHVSGMFVWTGFDYLGEPTPYWWPSRSSYFGIIDLAGFPKDAYYLYQSVWTGKPVLHLFPHWNWDSGDTVDVWAYTGCDRVELFLNGRPLGIREKEEGSLHMQWRVAYEPGKLEARGIHGDRELVCVVETTGKPAGVRLEADREVISAGGRDLSFVTVEIVDADGRVVPGADNLVTFSLSGPASIVGVDNGLQTSIEPFRADRRKAHGGRCLAVVRSASQAGEVTLRAESEGLEPDGIRIVTR